MASFDHKNMGKTDDSNFTFNKGWVSTICTLVVTEGGTQIYQSLSQGTFRPVGHCLRNAVGGGCCFYWFKWLTSVTWQVNGIGKWPSTHSTSVLCFLYDIKLTKNWFSVGGFVRAGGWWEAFGTPSTSSSQALVKDPNIWDAKFP